MPRVTFDKECFPRDSKGLRAGNRVEISINGILKTGVILRIFDYPFFNRYEAKIKCDDGKVNYKREEDITKII
jgi:hypothetical protein